LGAGLLRLPFVRNRLRALATSRHPRAAQKRIASRDKKLAQRFDISLRSERPVHLIQPTCRP
jgi:hypothetical protein